MDVYREVVEERANGVNRVVLNRVETDVANMVYVSYEVIVTEFEEWSGGYTKMATDEYYTNSVEAYADYAQLVKEIVGL